MTPKEISLGIRSRLPAATITRPAAPICGIRPQTAVCFRLAKLIPVEVDVQRQLRSRVPVLENALLGLTCLLLAATVLAQPAPPVRVIAEWEPATGTLISWPLGIPQDLVVELARDDTLFVLVTGQAAQNQAGATFTRWLLEEVSGLPVSAHDNWREGLLMLRYDAAVFQE